VLSPELENEIVKHLGDGRRPEELIVFVCERTGMKWDAAKEEVLRVRGRHDEEIQRRWKRFSVGLWIPTLIAGCLGTTFGLISMITNPLGFSIRVLIHSNYTLAVFGGGILALGGSLMALFGKGSRPRESNLDKSLSHKR
jgi:hypothetical protein